MTTDIEKSLLPRINNYLKSTTIQILPSKIGRFRLTVRAESFYAKIINNMRFDDILEIFNRNYVKQELYNVRCPSLIRYLHIYSAHDIWASQAYNIIKNLESSSLEELQIKTDLYIA